MKRRESYAARDVLRVSASARVHDVDRLAEEVPVEIVVDGEPYAVMLATPQDLVDFAIGFALTEGLVAHPGDVRDLVVSERLEGFSIVLATDHAPPPTASDSSSALPSASPPARGPRKITGRTGCGLCGSVTLEDAIRTPTPVTSLLRIEPGAITHALAALPACQPINAATGAVHAAAWCDVDGTVVDVREDVGRHNALDKLIGARLRAGESFGAGFLVLTSRASYEMVGKAATAGIAIVVAISAPTALAVTLANTAGVTLVGFAREARCVAYSHAERISAQSPSFAP